MKNFNKIGSAPISRRELVTGSIAAGSACLLLATNANATTTARVSKTAVHFDTVALTDHKCGSCKNFMAPSSCRFVEGSITSDCSCWIWTGKVG